MRATFTVLLFFVVALASGEEYYVLQGIDKTQPDSIVTAPGVDGFTIRVSWNKLHQEGFSWLDDQIARGNGLNTKIQLRVMAGKHAPANLLGVSYYEYLSTDSDGFTELRHAPVPWDATMRLHWQTLASQLGARYGNNQRIEVVHVPSFADSSEMHMPDEVTLLPGYSSPALAASWVAMAEPLEAAFPQAVLSLNYATPTQSQIGSEDSSWLLDELAMLAGNRAGYQANDLAADVSLDRNKYQTLIAQRQLGRSIGFQMVSSSETQRFGGSFLEAVALGIEAGAEWLEIYAADVDRIPRPGDYNLDGSVDSSDYIVWRNSLGSTISLFADGNDNHVVDAADYQIWKSHFGETTGASSATLSVLSNNHLTTVPEPAALLPALIGLLPILIRVGKPLSIVI